MCHLQAVQSKKKVVFTQCQLVCIYAMLFIGVIKLWLMDQMFLLETKFVEIEPHSSLCIIGGHFCAMIQN